jgi:diphthamide synthase (EF-2-diphthine--ammonia ligase)
MLQDERCALSFSGGKDSMLALDRALRQGFQVDFLVTMYDEASERVLSTRGEYTAALAS